MEIVIQQSGPDKLVEAHDYITWSSGEAVKLRMSESGAGSIPPVSIITLFKHVAERYPFKIAMVDSYSAKFHSITYREYYLSVQHVAKVFIKLGLNVGCSVGIIGFNSPQWFISHLAAIFAGGLSAGIYSTNSAETCKFICSISKCNIVVVEDEVQLKKFLTIYDDLRDLKAIIQYRGVPIIKRSYVYAWDAVVKMNVDDCGEDLQKRIDNISCNKCAVLIYTSGTTGEPKGAMLSHDNMIWSVKQLINRSRRTFTSETVDDKNYSGDIVVSYLPLSHIAGLGLDLYWPLISGGGTTYFARPDALKETLLETLKLVRPTVFMGVPRVWEKIMEKLQSDNNQNDVLANQKFETIPFNNDSLKVKTMIGLDRCRFMFSGGAPLNDKVLKYFWSLGVPVMEAHGMSETVGLHTTNDAQNYALGSCGRLSDGFQSKIVCQNKNAIDGEVRIKGRNVCMGYLNQEKLTKEAFDDEGWLKTGDIGRFDEDGFFYVTGRSKELIITSGGKNIAPFPIERRMMQRLPCLSCCMLVGDRRKFLSILLTFKTIKNPETNQPSDLLAPEALKWCQDAGSDVRTLPALSQSAPDSRITLKIQNAIDEVNKSATSRAHKIQKWLILPNDFSDDGGELGPTLKLRRNVVIEKYRNEIDRLYEISSI